MRRVLPLLLNVLIACATEAVMANNLSVELVNGDRLSGELLLRTADDVVLAHRVFGRISIPATEIASESVLPAAEVAEAADSPGREVGVTQPQSAAEAPVGWFADWERRISAGFSGARGNSNSQDANLALRLARADERARTLIESALVFARANGETRQAKYFAGITQDWLVPDSRWFYFAKGRYEFDEFQAWDHRLGASGGVGRELVSDDAVELRARAGVGFSRTFGDDNRFTPEGLIEVEGLWRIAADQVFTASASLVPDFGEPGEYRFLSSASWSTRLDRSGKLNLELGVSDEYDSDPDEDGISNNDFDYYGRIGYDF